MSELPKCPKCSSSYTYEDRGMCICPECAYEWLNNEIIENSEKNNIVYDAFRNELIDGDTVTVIKDLKIKGTSTVVKVGTKVKNVRIIEGDHNIDCKIEGIGAIQLKSEFVRKA